VDAVFRTFWPAQPSPYHKLGVLSAQALGFPVEVLSYRRVEVPQGVGWRDASGIVPGADHGHEDLRSPHMSLLRYRVLDALGGWWIDPDVMMVRAPRNDSAVFIAAEECDVAGAAVLAAEPGHRLFRAAAGIAESAGASGDASHLGTILLTRLTHELGLGGSMQPASTAYELAHYEVWKLFDPERREEVERRLEASRFCCTWHEVWRRAALDFWSAPPRGSYLDGHCRLHGVRAEFKRELTLEGVARLRSAHPRTARAGSATPMDRLRQMLSAARWHCREEQAPEHKLARIEEALDRMASAAERVAVDWSAMLRERQAEVERAVGDVQACRQAYRDLERESERRLADANHPSFRRGFRLIYLRLLAELRRWR